VKVRIDKIDLGDRIRDDLGDIDKLAESIEEIGLVSPITVEEKEDSEYRLVAGYRRIKAYERLGRERIEARIISGDKDKNE